MFVQYEVSCAYTPYTLTPPPHTPAGAFVQPTDQANDAFTNRHAASFPDWADTHTGTDADADTER